MTSPVSHTPCFFYKVDIKKWKTDGNSGSWSHYRTDADGVKFYLEDTSGKVRVDAHGAEYGLIQTEKREVGGTGAALQRLLSEDQDLALITGSATDSELLGYVNRVTASKTSFSSKAGWRLRDPSPTHIGSRRDWRL